jgi:Zn-dependent M32 family carboxypeptidase
VDEFSPGVSTADIEAIFKALSRRLPNLIREALSLQAERPSLPIWRQIRGRQAARSGARGHAGDRLSLRSRPAR